MNNIGITMRKTGEEYANAYTLMSKESGYSVSPITLALLNFNSEYKEARNNG